MTPEEAYSGKRPNIGHLKVYRCLAYAYIPQETRGKLETTSVATCLVGYMPTTRQYQLYDPIGRRIIVSLAPTFRENERLAFNWNYYEPGDLVRPFDPISSPERDNDIPNNLDDDRGADDLSERLRGSLNLILTTLPPGASRASGGMCTGDRIQQTILEVPPAQNTDENQSNQPESSRFEADDIVDLGDH